MFFEVYIIDVLLNTNNSGKFFSSTLVAQYSVGYLVRLHFNDGLVSADYSTAQT